MNKYSRIQVIYPFNRALSVTEYPYWLTYRLKRGEVTKQDNGLYFAKCKKTLAEGYVVLYKNGEMIPCVSIENITDETGRIVEVIIKAL